jgi:hypothetical protein
VSDAQGLLLPGWFCPAPCGVFNGTMKGPKLCRACDAPPPAPDPHGCAGLGRADLLRLIAGLASECRTLNETTTRVQERCTELLEENRALRRALPAFTLKDSADGFSCSRCGVRSYVGYTSAERLVGRSKEGLGTHNLVCLSCLEGEGR